MGDGSTQVNAEFYQFSQYVTFERWSSYWHQVSAALRYQPKSLVEVGGGLGVTSQVLRQCGVDVTTFDYDSTLKPDIVGDVRRLDEFVAPKSVDMVCAYQILEHLPFEDFGPALGALSRVARRNVVISLPHYGYPVELRGRLWKNRFAFGFARRIAKPKTWNFDGQHYWELGTRGYAIKTVAKEIAKRLDIKRQYFCPDYSYHYFFECEVKA